MIKQFFQALEIQNRLKGYTADITGYLADRDSLDPKDDSGTLEMMSVVISMAVIDQYVYGLTISQSLTKAMDHGVQSVMDTISVYSRDVRAIFESYTKATYLIGTLSDEEWQTFDRLFQPYKTSIVPFLKTIEASK